MTDGAEAPDRGPMALMKRAARLLADQRMRTALIALLMLIVVAIAVVALSHILRETSWAQITAAIRRIGWARLVACAALTIASYLVLTCYDVIALRIIGRRVPYPRIALASFTSYIFSHNFGFAVLTGGTARLRIYRRAGLGLGEVAQIIALAGVTFWLGVFLMLGVALVSVPNLFAAEGWHLPDGVQPGIGAAILIGLLAYLVFLRFRGGRAVNLFGWHLVLPSGRMAITQFILAALDLTLATLALFVLIPGLGPAAFGDVLVGYLAAFVSGLLTHAPGGVGVFEAVMLVTLPQIDRTALFAALIVYRFLYYLVPLAIGLVLFTVHELVGRREESVPDDMIRRG